MSTNELLSRFVKGWELIIPLHLEGLNDCHNGTVRVYQVRVDWLQRQGRCKRVSRDGTLWSHGRVEVAGRDHWRRDSHCQDTSRCYSSTLRRYDRSPGHAPLDPILIYLD